VSGEVQALATTTTLLEGGAIMLGTALVFVTLFRKLGLAPRSATSSAAS